MSSGGASPKIEVSFDVNPGDLELARGGKTFFIHVVVCWYYCWDWETKTLILILQLEMFAYSKKFKRTLMNIGNC